MFCLHESSTGDVNSDQLINVVSLLTTQYFPFQVNNCLRGENQTM